MAFLNEVTHVPFLRSMGREFQSLVADTLKVLPPSDSRLYLGQTRFKALPFLLFFVPLRSFSSSSSSFFPLLLLLPRSSSSSSSSSSFLPPFRSPFLLVLLLVLHLRSLKQYEMSKIVEHKNAHSDDTS